MYILNTLIKIVKILSKSQQTDLFLMCIFFIISAIVQIAGIASIAPFISLLSDPSIIDTNPVYKAVYEFSNATDVKAFTIYFAVASLVLIFLSNFTSAITLWLLFNFSVKIGAQIQSELFKNYLFKDYIFHKTENYNTIIARIAQETPRFVYMVLQPFLLLISQTIVATLIIAGLIIINPWIAISSALIIGLTYGITYLSVKKSLIKNGNVITQRNTLMQAILSECFIGIKEIKLNHTESANIEKLNSVNFKGLRAQSNVVLTGDIPKFVIETVSFGAILLLAIIALMQGQDSKHLTTVLSIYAIAGYKLLPTVQQLYKSIASISANADVIGMLHKDLKSSPSKIPKEKTKKLLNIESIVIESANYTYPSNARAGIFDISLQFSRGNIYTIAGHSGSGKSTLADVLLGLLPLSSGQILINGKEGLSDENLAHYQYSLGYVPQSIFILDDTIIRNVAFGIPDHEINLAQVEQALKKAQAWDFVCNLSNGLHTPLGQDGRLLSGGQRQRIGIARSLYQKRSVLILDEPTSALDIESEYEIMKLLQQLKKEILIIVISHRPSAIKLSDNIILLEDGRITANSSYDLLLQSDSHFKELMEKGFGNFIESQPN
jgi:ATP-binding cassette, subfamily B, bacterial PglK